MALEERVTGSVGNDCLDNHRAGVDSGISRNSAATAAGAFSRPLLTTKQKMKHEIEIKNGSGWNNYAALKGNPVMPRGIKALMREEGVRRLEIGPADWDRPLGIAATYYDEHGDEMFCQRFDRDDSWKWIRERVEALLTEGIAERIEANRIRREKELAEGIAFEARCKGMTVEEYAVWRAAAKAAAKAAAEAAEAAKAAEAAALNDPARADAVEEQLRELRRQFPQATWLSRAGLLMTGTKSGIKGQPYTPPQTMPHEPLERLSVRAWLQQRGSHSIDDRQKLFDAAKPL